MSKSLLPPCKESVALRKESVDRNRDRAAHGILDFKSLSARRAWIEIDFAFDIPTIHMLSLSARRAWIEIT